MSFTPGIPSDGQSLGNSKPQVRGNFTVINDTMSINHVAMNSLGAGKHKFLQMPEQGSAPTTISNEGSLYTKEAQGITNLFWRQESNGSEIQLTNSGISATNRGYSFLPGGILIQWGFQSNYSTGTDINFPISFSQIPFNIQVTQYDAFNTSDQRCVSAIFVDNVKFQARVTTLGSNPNDSSCKINWVAIGRNT